MDIHSHIGPKVSALSNKLKRKIESLSFPDLYAPAQGKALHFILMHADEKLFQKDIEEEFGIRPASASELLKNMEANGLIRRVPLPEDTRYKQIIPSEAALARRREVVRDMENVESKLREGISPADLAVWVKVTERMTQNL